MQIWDTAGQERFKNLSKNYYKGAHGIAIVYDVTNKNSFDNIMMWIEEISQKAAENVFKILIGNKADMKNLRVISQQEGEEIAKLYSMPYFETSAKNDECVREVFDFMATNIVSLISITPSYLQHTKDSIMLKSRKKPEKRRKCCAN